MDFVTSLNDYVFLLFICLCVLIFIGIRLGLKNGGWNRHLPYMWTLIVYSQYAIISPYFFYLNDRKYILETDISNYYGLGFFFNLLAVLSFIIGYWVLGFKIKEKWNNASPRELKNPKKIISIIFYALYSVILLNLAIGGIDVRNIFLGSERLGLGARGASYFFRILPILSLP